MPAYVYDKKTNELVKVAGNAGNDEIFSGLPPLKEDFMYFDSVLFDHIPDAQAGYVRLNYDGRIVANNDIETGLYRFSMTYITNDEM